jgi:hypothetical protein
VNTSGLGWGLRPGLWKDNQLPNYSGFHTTIISVAFLEPSFRSFKGIKTNLLKVVKGGSEGSEKLFRS